MDVTRSTGPNGFNYEVKVELENIQGSCRVCMGRSDNMKHIFEGELDGIIERVEFCTGLHLTNEASLPSQICDTCLQHLTIAHSFKTSCLLSEETFRKMLSEKIKTEKIEYPDDDDDFSWRDDSEDVKDIMLNEVLSLGDVTVKRVVKEEEDSPEPPKPKKIRGPYKKRKNPPKKQTRNRKIKKYTFVKLHCDICKIKFQTKEERLDHKKNVHNDESWICEICGKVFTNRATHYSHLRSHLPPKYQCDTCDYKTWHKHDLVKHIRIHTGEKNYQCEFCTTSYHTSSNLVDHIRRVHKAAERRFRCTLCERRFHDRSKLNRHLDSHNDVKRFECPSCSSAFTRRCYWKKHLLRAHGIALPPQRPGRQKTNDVVDAKAYPHAFGSLIAKSDDPDTPLQT